MGILRRLPAVLLALLFLLGTGVTASAHETPDLGEKGSITAAMTYGGEAVPGGTLTLYRVGAVSEEDGDYGFALTGAFAGCGETLAEPDAPELAGRLAEFVRANGLEGTTAEIDGTGRVSFGDLEPGLYLLLQNEAATGYNEVKPFLVSLPMWENGGYIYHVDAGPKVELERESEPEPEPENPPPVTPSGPTLPQTGQLNWPIPVLAVLGLGLFAVGWTLKFDKKRDGHEK